MAATELQQPANPPRLLRHLSAISVPAAVIGLLCPVAVIAMRTWPALAIVIVASVLIAVAVHVPYTVRSLIARQRQSTSPGDRFWHSRAWPARNHEHDKNPPHYPHALVGYRRFRLGPHGELLPAVSRAAAAWRPGRNEARCITGHPADIPVPAPDCHCGFNAFNWVADAEFSYFKGHLISGAILAGGQTETYSLGFRSEIAAVIALQEPADPRLRNRARRAAARYRIPLVKSREDLVTIASKSGGLPLPRRACPSPGKLDVLVWLLCGVPRVICTLDLIAGLLAAVGIAAAIGEITVSGFPVLAVAAGVLLCAYGAAYPLWRLWRGLRFLVEHRRAG